MPKEPTKLIPKETGEIDPWYTKLPSTIAFDNDLNISDIQIYVALDVLAGKRGWWYGEQEEILTLAGEKLAGMGHTISFSLPSTSTFRRSIKKLREKRYIVTEKLGLKMNNLLKYYLVARNPELPPIYKRT